MFTIALNVADAVVLSCCTALSRLQKTEEESRGLPTKVGSDLVENFHLQRNRRVLNRVSVELFVLLVNKMEQAIALVLVILKLKHTVVPKM